ncbi:hypothetical protein QQY66_30195 [Streptomyces sp. DG2A-72]|uniref:hypothetical protein n=1 Tax=Streptomyces sp. DG2A-72 TaxID=3051386 RepID=UPI00265C2E5E|nr:hypothetical protein [Streptomyces sp. DG2A-72]MDO0935744.1 hypothetical protein [Streptomyces sp. DG2A-72]
MQMRRKLARLVAGTGLVAGTLLATAPAQAASPAEQTAGVSAQADAGVLVSSPSISPAAEQVRYVTSPTGYTCSYGRLCARVWDPNVSKWKVFDLYACRTYSLSQWNGTGGYVNNQTTGTTARFYNSSGSVIHSSTALDTDSSYSWTPVWKIKNC